MSKGEKKWGTWKRRLLDVPHRNVHKTFRLGRLSVFPNWTKYERPFMNVFCTYIFGPCVYWVLSLWCCFSCLLAASSKRKCSFSRVGKSSHWNFWSPHEMSEKSQIILFWYFLGKSVRGVCLFWRSILCIILQTFVVSVTYKSRDFGIGVSKI